MGILSSRVLPVLGLIILGACGQTKVLDDCDCGFYTDQAGNKVTWKDGETVKFAFHSGVPSNVRPAVSAGVLEYNNIFKSLRVSVSSAASDRPSSLSDNDPQSVSGDGVNGIYWITRDWPWQESNPDSDAMTVVRFTRGRIVEADIYFRAGSFPSQNISVDSAGFKPQEASVDAQYVYVIAVHEVGHALGRVHTDNEDSIMFPQVGLDFVSQPFSLWDLETFQSVYQLSGNPARLASTR
jgi:hypothetical protein